MQCGCIILLLTMISISSNLSLADADIYVITGSDEGIAVYNGTSIYMPQAQVEINITRSSNPAIEIEFYGNYSIETDISQNISFAFVYPQMWDYASTPTPIGYTIFVNGEEVPYTTKVWEDVGFGNLDDEVTFTGHWIYNAFFAVFDLALSNESTTQIEVTHQGEYEYLGNEFIFNYIVGSACSFSGETHQTVHMQLEEETPFLDVTFLPTKNLTIWEADSKTHALWDFVVQGSNINEVSMRAIASTYVGGGTGPTPSDTFTTSSFTDNELLLLQSLLGGMMVGVGCLTILWFSRKSMKG